MIIHPINIASKNVSDGNGDFVSQALFGDYFVEIAKFFGAFKSYRANDVQYQIDNAGNYVYDEWDQLIPNPNFGLPKNLKVIFGSPRASFREIYETTNGKMNLPMLNFNAPDWTPIKSRNLPQEIRVKLPIHDDEEFILDEFGNPTATENPNFNSQIVTSLPLNFEVLYNCTLWCADEFERDDLVRKIIVAFGQGEICLEHRPEGVSLGEVPFLMPLTLEEQWTDDTEVEGMENTETKDTIVTSFNMRGQSQLPRNMVWIKKVSSLFTQGITKWDDTENPQEVPLPQ